MKKIAIATDSHSSIHPETAKELGVFVLPMPMIMDAEMYYEDTTLTRDEFFRRLESGAEVGTSQAAPGELTDFWDGILKGYDELVYIPLSSGLSGACQTAKMLAQDEPYAGRVYVADVGRISTPQHQSVLDALEMVRLGYSAKEICEVLEASTDEFVVYIAVDTLEYLKKGGRVSPAAAAIGTILGIKPILHLATGKLDSFRKARGMVKAKQLMIETIREDMAGKFAEACARNEVQLMIATSASPEKVAEWKHEVEEAFPGMSVMSDDLSMGICCHTGPDALGIGLCTKPKKIWKHE